MEPVGKVVLNLKEEATAESVEETCSLSSGLGPDMCT